MKKICVLILFGLVVFGLAACATPSTNSSTAVPAGNAEVIQPVEAFYNAIVEQNRDRVSAIACADWEKDALRDVDSFMGVKSELKEFSCTVAEMGSDEATVTCSGMIAASYGAEITNFPLDNRNHKVIKEQGEWRICGY